MSQPPPPPPPPPPPVPPPADFVVVSLEDSEAGDSPRSAPPVPAGVTIGLPLPLRLAAILCSQIVVWVCQLWNVVAGLLFVVPVRIASWVSVLAAGEPLRATLRRARYIAQRPLLAAFFSLSLPSYGGERGWAVDFDAMPERPRSFDELLSVMKPGGRALRALRSRFRHAHRSVAAAGLVVSRVECLSPGVEHRRLILAHCRQLNSANPTKALFFALCHVWSAHTFTGTAFEFRDGSGALKALSLTVKSGSWSIGALYAADKEVSRSGVWVRNLQLTLEEALMDSSVRLVDVGPSQAALKAAYGLKPLGVRHCIRVAFGRWPERAGDQPMAVELAAADGDGGGGGGGGGPPTEALA